ncbi:hypothetical protein L4C36_15255 [Photobacterium japonica]|uniref:hypothetical protein n=1 Tax=Photobacterium japonica TaxID=2910235 RepID=UPI003D135B48
MKKTLLLLATLFPPSIFAQGDDCTVFTNKEDMVTLAKDIVGAPITIENKRLYSLIEGELFFAYTDDCGLGREGMLLLPRPYYSDEEKIKKAQWMLKAFYGENTALLKRVIAITPQGQVSILDENEQSQHVFTFSRHAPDDYRTGLFSESITYTWIPPEEY